MLGQGKLIVNESYKDLFGDTGLLRRDFFIIPKFSDFDRLDNVLQTRALALWLAAKDETPGVVYGVEIKSNGSERSSRIPLVRADAVGASMWKLVSTVGDVERAVTTLDQLAYFLKRQGGAPVPTKVLVLCDDEKTFVPPASEHHIFVERVVSEHGLTVFSYEYLRQLVEGGEVASLQGLLKRGPKLYTTATP